MEKIEGEQRQLDGIIINQLPADGRPPPIAGGSSYPDFDFFCDCWDPADSSSSSGSSALAQTATATTRPEMIHCFKR